MKEKMRRGRHKQSFGRWTSLISFPNFFLSMWFFKISQEWNGKNEKSSVQMDGWYPNGTGHERWWSGVNKDSLPPLTLTGRQITLNHNEFALGAQLLHHLQACGGSWQLPVWLSASNQVSKSDLRNRNPSSTNRECGHLLTSRSLLVFPLCGCFGGISGVW